MQLYLSSRLFSLTVLTLAPGTLLAAAIALVAATVSSATGLSWLSPMIIAVLIGMLINRTLGAPTWTEPGLAFTMRPLLRLAVMLLGLQLSFAQLGALGLTGLLVVAACVAATFIFTLVCGRLLGVDPALTELIAAGTSICGASAVVAVNTVTRAREEDVAYAISCVTLFGTIAMLAFPLLQQMIQLAPLGYGLWIGTSVHEVAQVVAAGFQGGAEAGEFATISKLARVMMLAPVVLVVGHLSINRRASSSGVATPAIPWFVAGFICLMVVNSLVSISEDLLQAVQTTTGFLLTAALAAVGMQTNLGKLISKGFRPLVLGLAAFLFIGTMALGLVVIAM